MGLREWIFLLLPVPSIAVNALYPSSPLRYIKEARALGLSPQVWSKLEPPLMLEILKCTDLLTRTIVLPLLSKAMASRFGLTRELVRNPEFAHAFLHKLAGQDIKCGSEFPQLGDIIRPAMVHPEAYLDLFGSPSDTIKNWWPHLMDATRHDAFTTIRQAVDELEPGNETLLCRHVEKDKSVAIVRCAISGARTANLGTGWTAKALATIISHVPHPECLLVISEMAPDLTENVLSMVSDRCADALSIGLFFGEVPMPGLGSYQSLAETLSPLVSNLFLACLLRELFSDLPGRLEAFGRLASEPRFDDADIGQVVRLIEELNSDWMVLLPITERLVEHTRPRESDHIARAMAAAMSSGKDADSVLKMIEESSSFPPSQLALFVYHHVFFSPHYADSRGSLLSVLEKRSFALAGATPSSFRYAEDTLAGLCTKLVPELQMLILGHMDVFSKMFVLPRVSRSMRRLFGLKSVLNCPQNCVFTASLCTEVFFSPPKLDEPSFLPRDSTSILFEWAVTKRLCDHLFLDAPLAPSEYLGRRARSTEEHPQTTKQCRSKWLLHLSWHVRSLLESGFDSAAECLSVLQSLYAFVGSQAGIDPTHVDVTSNIIGALAFNDRVSLQTSVRIDVLRELLQAHPELVGYYPQVVTDLRLMLNPLCEIYTLLVEKESEESARMFMKDLMARLQQTPQNFQALKRALAGLCLGPNGRGYNSEFVSSLPGGFVGLLFEEIDFSGTAFQPLMSTFRTSGRYVTEEQFSALAIPAAANLANVDFLMRCLLRIDSTEASSEFGRQIALRVTDPRDRSTLFNTLAGHYSDEEARRVLLRLDMYCEGAGGGMLGQAKSHLLYRLQGLE